MSKLFALIVVVSASLIGILAPARSTEAAQGPAVPRQFCSGTVAGDIQAELQWAPLQSGDQWLDLSLANNGFAPGTFVTVGPLVPTTSDFLWDGLAAGRTHYIRVNTLTPAGWVPSETTTFATGTCFGATSPPLANAVSFACAADSTILGAFAWAPAQPKGVVQWLDLSTTNNGFAPGTFVSAGPLNPGDSSFTWTGIRPSTTHYWRVNTWTGSTWVASNTSSFTSGYCSVASGPPVPPSPPASTGYPSDVKWCLGYLAGYSSIGRFNCGNIYFGSYAFDVQWCIGYLSGYVTIGRLNCGNIYFSNTYPADFTQCIGYLSGYSSIGRFNCDDIYLS